ncbi:unnamed protein product [Linum trigynum]|uniref:Secreted protein n=1 Tax=Linum trigynum TaxID=586398 RepID=A0AAV2C8Y9_9ROSI
MRLRSFISALLFFPKSTCLKSTDTLASSISPVLISSSSSSPPCGFVALSSSRPICRLSNSQVDVDV